MTPDYEVIIKGFTSKEQAEEFINWYSEQGEQDINVWLEARLEEGILDIDGLDCDNEKTFPIKRQPSGSKESLILYIKPSLSEYNYNNKLKNKRKREQ